MRIPNQTTGAVWRSDPSPLSRLRIQRARPGNGQASFTHAADDGDDDDHDDDGDDDGDDGYDES